MFDITEKEVREEVSYLTNRARRAGELVPVFTRDNVNLIQEHLNWLGVLHQNQVDTGDFDGARDSQVRIEKYARAYFVRVRALDIIENT